MFVVSDFLGEEVPASAWLTAAARRWEVVPVVVQDPVWEGSFPNLHSVVVPLVDPESGRGFDVHISSREARSRRAQNERRRAELLAGFVALGVNPVVVETSDGQAIDNAFAEWAAERRTLRLRR